jgi:coproporphyrinogen III oxidase-like Fe-S oxidoreductase
VQTISLKLPDDLLAQLEREAKARGVTKSLLVRESLEKTLRLRSREMAETAFPLKREGHDAARLFVLLERGITRIALSVQDEQADLRTLMRRYRNRPMSLADACLVRLSEIHESKALELRPDVSLR